MRGQGTVLVEQEEMQTIGWNHSQFRRGARWSVQNRLLWGVVAVGMLLRIGQWTSRRSYYLDESALLLSIFRRPLKELVSEPLLFEQSAPPGFLVLERMAFLLWGPGELGMRLFPLMAGLASVLLFALLVRRLLPGLEAFLVTALFALSSPHIYFASDVKPYSIDVLAAVLILLYTDHVCRRGFLPRLILLGTVIGFGTVLFSQTAIFVLAGAGSLLLLKSWKCSHGEQRLTGALLVVSWTTAGVLSLILAKQRLSEAGLEYMRDFWQSGFLPVAPNTLRELLWLPLALARFSFDSLGSAPGVLVVPCVLGLIWFARNNVRALGLAVIPIFVVLLASALHQYPFGANDMPIGHKNGRVVLFLSPSMLLLVGGGFAWLRLEALPRRPRVALVLLAAFAAPTVLLLVWIFPEKRQEIRPVLEQVDARREPGDLIYVYYGAQHSFRVYAPLIPLEPGSITYGICSRRQTDRYLLDLEQLRGHPRVWLIFATISDKSRSTFRDHLQRIGLELGRLKYHGAEAWLYDLSIQPGAHSDPPTAGTTASSPRLSRLLSCDGIFSGLQTGTKERDSAWGGQE